MDKKTKTLPKLHPLTKDLISLIRRREVIDEDIANIALKLRDRAALADAMGSLMLTVERAEGDTDG